MAATLLIVSGLAIQLTRSHLTRSLDARLEAVVESFRSGPARTVNAVRELMPAVRGWLQATAVREDEVVAVRTPDGEVLSSAGGLDLESVPRSAELLRSAEARWWDVEGPEGEVRALTVPLVLGGRSSGTIVAAASRSDLDATLSTLLSQIALAGLLGLAFATILGVAAVRRTLRPLHRMSRAVEEVEATGDLSRRVGGEGPRDEVGRLASAFDGMLARLEDSFRSQRRFLSDASHELRTPLQVTRGQLELLEEGLRDPESRRSLAVAEEELERMRRIVEDLLLLARLDEGLPLAREPVEVELVVREALLRGLQVARRRTRVEVERGLYALADPERLLQVLTNLVSNAVRHAGDQASITVRGESTDEGALIEVIDDGRGIPPEDLPHVFERLYRGSRARAVPGGAGLGLPIAASLAEAMGGRISVRSEPGRVTAFTLVLPAPAALEPAPVA